MRRLATSSPNEFGHIKNLTNAKPIEEVMLDLKEIFKKQDVSVKLSPGLFEFLWHTMGTNTEVEAGFGLPFLGNETHPEAHGLTNIQLDFDDNPMEEKYKIWINLDTKSKAFGQLVLDSFEGTRKFRKVSTSFEEFLALYADLVEMYAVTGADERGEVLVEFYNRFLLDEGDAI